MCAYFVQDGQYRREHLTSGGYGAIIARFKKRQRENKNEKQRKKEAKKENKRKNKREKEKNTLSFCRFAVCAYALIGL